MNIKFIIMGSDENAYGVSRIIYDKYKVKPLLLCSRILFPTKYSNILDIKIIDNFDLEQNVKFSTYAVPMIIGEIRRYLRDNNSIRVSRSTKDLAYKALKYKEEYVLTNGKEPSCEEISKKLDCTTYDVVNALESLKDPVSMFEPIYSDGGDTIYLYDQIEDKRQTGSEMENRLATNDAITMLSDRCQQILEERFIIGKTQMEVAEDLAISQAQVSRLEKNAVKQLKRILK